MARRFLLSYRQSERRWRKRYRGKYHYFPLLDDETKLSSYQRVLREWTQLKAKLDLDTEGKAKAEKAWAPILAAVREAQQHVIDTHVVIRPHQFEDCVTGTTRSRSRF